MSEPITLPVHCPWCGTPLDLKVDDWQIAGPGSDAVEMKPEYYACPVCLKTNSVTIPGTIVRVTRRLLPKD